MKHRLFKLALFLILGAIVNVAVAWGCVLWADPIDNHVQTEHQTAWRFLIKRHLAFKHSGNLNAWCWSDFWVTYRMINLTKTDLNTSHADDADSKCIHLFLVSAGFPMRSLISEWRGKGNSVREVQDSIHLIVGIEVDKWVDSPHNYKSALPIQPLWPGFATNAVFYAAILWLPFAPFRLRRYLRIKRGHCIKCGYDLRHVEHEKCPECGNELAAKVKL